MATLTLPADVTPGYVANAVALTAVQEDITIDFDVSGQRVGDFRISFIANVEWFYKFEASSSNECLIPAKAPLIIPVFDGMVIGARGTGAGTLYSLVMEVPRG